MREQGGKVVQVVDQVHSTSLEDWCQEFYDIAQLLFGQRAGRPKVESACPEQNIAYALELLAASGNPLPN